PGVDAETHVTGGTAARGAYGFASLFNQGARQNLQLVGWGPLTDGNITGPSDDKPY
uniref:E2/NS1 protein (cDNA 2) (Fragments) n=1 Tax=Hepacivirus hominis TaxID=3052230 RepID=Q7M017_9HEPC